MTKVLVIGDAIIDHYAYGRVNRPSPEDRSVSVFDLESECCKLGGALNVAANIASLNSALNLTVSSVFTLFCKEELIKRGIGYDGIMVPEEFSLVKSRFVNLETNKQIVRVDRNKKFCEKVLVSYNKHTLWHLDLSKVECVVISDYEKGVIDSKTIDHLKKFRGVVFVDTKKPDLTIWNDIPNCILKVNFNEWHNAKQQSKHPVIVTVGEKGAELHNTQDWHDTIEFPVEEIENPDVVGCGDTFLAGLVVKYLECHDISDSIKYANKAASEAAKHQGTVEVKL